MITAVRKNARIIGSLMMREIMTRFGREGLGFVWLVGEPLLFCGGVIAMWSLLKSPYDHGIRVAPFVMTGYMCLLLIRHIISYNMGAIQANIGLLYHRHVTVLHIIIARDLLELAGGSLAFIVVYAALFAFDQIALPADFLLIFYGWSTLFFLTSGLGLLFSALAIEFEVMERIIPVMMYLMIPISGVFMMVGWLPEPYRSTLLLIPIPHSVEMVRAGVFGEFVETHFTPLYPLAWGMVLNVAGLLLLARAKKHVDID
ncbi:ABC transporter permease [Brevundimonas sp.]|jgi:capsular polysaccharide transport system permease protein|uniref:ABC transporter permease n=1 Tax=Brevundimonas sp. TaxID=1871086 RepID=UPI0037C18DE8